MESIRRHSSTSQNLAEPCIQLTGERERKGGREKREGEREGGGGREREREGDREGEREKGMEGEGADGERERGRERGWRDRERERERAGGRNCTIFGAQEDLGRPFNFSYFDLRVKSRDLSMTLTFFFNLGVSGS